MKLLTRISIASVIVSIPAVLLTFTTLIMFLNGTVNYYPFGGDLTEWTYFFLVVVAVPVELAAIVIAARARHRSLITAGHAFCLFGLIAQLLMLIFPTTGWGLFSLPAALTPGQLVVLAGLILHAWRR